MIQFTAIAAAVSALLVFFMSFRLSELERRLAALSGIDGKLDALLEQAGIEYDPFENISEEVVRAIQRGEKIQAIKHYREATGTGLKEAKEFVEALQRHLKSSR